MELIHIYAILVGACFGSLFLFRIGRILFQNARQLYIRLIRKYVFYPLITRRRAGTTNVSIFDAFAIALYTFTNIAFLAVRDTSWATLGQRSSLLFVVNLVPLCLGGRTNILLDKFFRIDKDRNDVAHRWIGRICFIEGSVHGIIALIYKPSATTRLGIPVSFRPVTYGSDQSTLTS